jgi:hypothetical protein
MNIRGYAQSRWEEKDFRLTEVDLEQALAGYTSSDWAKREDYPMMGFLKDPYSWIGKTQANSSSDWKTNPGLLRLRAAFEAINAPVIDADWEDACDLWCLLSLADQEKAINRVSEYDGAFIRRPKNYILKREFDRPPRPAPKTALEKAMDLA